MPSIQNLIRALLSAMFVLTISACATTATPDTATSEEVTVSEGTAAETTESIAVEAVEETAPPADPAPAPKTVKGKAADVTARCSKAYAAKKACEKAPGPFGSGVRICMASLKSKYKGLTCPVPLF